MGGGRFSIEILGKREFDAAVRRVQSGLEAGAHRAVVSAAIEGRAEVVKAIQRGPASGRVYQKKNPTRMHQASAPGEAPATDTGRLANNIFFDVIGDKTASFGSTLVYALHLEYGTTKMAARPHFRPAAEKIRAKFKGMVETEIRRATQ